MSKYTTSVIMSAVVSAVTFATAQAQQTVLAIPDNDSVYIDAKSFEIVPGKGKGDAGAQIKDLGARELGPGAIIIRSDNKLYIAEGQTLRGVVTAYAYDPRQYNPGLTGGGSIGYNRQFAYDPRQYNPSLTGGGSVGYNQQFANDPRQYNPSLTGGGSPGYNSMLMQFANDPRQYNPSLTGGGSPGYNTMFMQFAYDPRQYNPSLTGGGSPGYNAMLMQFAYDPDYVQYKLKKAFEDNWIPAATPANTKG